MTVNKTPLLLVALASLTAMASADVPKVLVIQGKVPVTKDGDPNLQIANVLAQEVNDAGKLNSIVWSMTDVNFRTAVLEGKVRIPNDAPKIADAFPVAHAFGADYVLLIDVAKDGKVVRARANLFRGGKSIWKDVQEMSAETSGKYDADSTGSSLARTIVLRMNNGPLKSLQAQTRVETPEPARGQAPVPVPPPTEPSTPKSPAADIRARVAVLMREKNVTGAVSAARDAIDLAPFEPEPRLVLIDLLMDRDPALAAAEARRAANLLPDRGDLRLLAARAWMKAGKSKEAQDDLNQAVVRAPDSAATRLLLAEVALQQGKPETALPHLDQSIKSEPSAEAHFLRAICRAMLGGTDGVALDLKAIEKPSPEDVERRHRFAVERLAPLFDDLSADVRGLIQRAIVKPKDAEVREALDNDLRLLAARTALLQGLPAPATAQKGHDRLLLAHRLLTQSLLDLQRMTGGETDALTDARMNLGEAIKQAKLARTETTP